VTSTISPGLAARYARAKLRQGAARVHEVASEPLGETNRVGWGGRLAPEVGMSASPIEAPREARIENRKDRCGRAPIRHSAADA